MSNKLSSPPKPCPVCGSSFIRTILDTENFLGQRWRAFIKCMDCEHLVGGSTTRSREKAEKLVRKEWEKG